ncbi:putative metalloprotease arx1 [Rhizophlyctis rosea]|uniref:Probable metalloprotease ARX1 n=1 Tax=Rhizophlyctis rosea TaxID=64517 RepID=A0AAD5X2M7_9FUNG|nr:putative metalloprotease arx1 [Rhizophlyctis rosea]
MSTAMEIYQNERFDADNQLSDSNVVNKYHSAAAIANEAMRRVLEQVQIGRRVIDICKLGDDYILSTASKMFKKGERGIARPTCLSINNVVRNYCPCDDDQTVLVAGDVVKIELGAHIDGYIATLAHTTVMNPNPQQPITGPTADAICAAYYASQIALRLIKPGTSSSEVIDAISRVTAAFNCRPVDGTSSFVIKRYLLEGGNELPNVLDPSNPTEPFTFQSSEAYSLNIFVSTGTGQLQPSPLRPTIFQRDVTINYPLKLKSARQLLQTVSHTFGVFPFPLRAALEVDPKFRIGLNECVGHGVMVPRDVMGDVEGSKVAHFGVTVLVLASGTMVMTGGEGLSLPYVHSEFGVETSGLAGLLNNAVRTAKTKVPGETTASGDVNMDLS